MARKQKEEEEEAHGLKKETLAEESNLLPHSRRFKRRSKHVKLKEIDAERITSLHHPQKARDPFK